MIEYSHYSVGFEFRIFATIRSGVNIRTIIAIQNTHSTSFISLKIIGLGPRISKLDKTLLFVF